MMEGRSRDPGFKMISADERWAETTMTFKSNKCQVLRLNEKQSVA